MKAIAAGLGTLGAFRLAILALVAVGTLGLLGFLALHRGAEHFSLLYGELDLRDAAKIADSLDRQHIAHAVSPDGTRIMVPADQVAAARLLLARQSLPSGGSIGYEIFDRTDGFTASQFLQNIDQLRALEGELSRSIRAIDGVRAARVHLVLAKREPFARERQEAQASVLLTTAGAGRLDSESVQAIVHLVAAAVPGLRPGNVSVVDSQGELLARAGDPAGRAGSAASAEAIRRGIEQRMSHAVEALLAHSLGEGHVRAEATVAMNFDRTEESQQTFNPDGQVVRSTQSTTDKSRTTEKAGTVSVTNNLPNANAGAPAAGTQDARQDETTNYEISSTKRSLVHDQAQISRISLAVMVDGEMVAGPGGKPLWQPRPAAELARIRQLVQSAVGFDAKRGDQIDVVSMRFVAQQEAAPPPPRGLFGTGIGRDALLSLAQPLVMGLVATLALLLVLRPMVTRLTGLADGGLALAGGGYGGGMLGGPAGTAPGGMAPGGMAPGGPAAGGQALLAGPQDAAADELVQMANVEGAMRASSIRKLAELVEKHPDESLSIVRGWMQQETS